MDRVLTNPTRKRLRAAIENVLDEANGRARVRTVSPWTPEDVFRYRYGLLVYDGGGVPYSYRYPAETTQIQIVWMSRGGKKIVKLTAKRTSASRKVSEVERCVRSQLTNTYPRADRYDIWAVFNPKRYQTWRERLRARMDRIVDRLGPAATRISHRSLRHVMEHAPGVGLILADSRKNPRLVMLLYAGSNGRISVTLPPRFARRDSAVFRDCPTPAQRVYRAIDHARNLA